MALPTPATTQTTDAVLYRIKALLGSSLLTSELATQQTALRTASGDNTLTLPAPGLIAIGDPRWAETVGQLTPGLIIYAEASETISADVAGDTYHVETPVSVVVCMASADTAAIHEEGMYTALLRYSHAVAIVMQTSLSSAAYGGSVGVYDCIPQTWALSEPPIRIETGWSVRYTMSRHLVRWQTRQPAPAQP